MKELSVVDADRQNSARLEHRLHHLESGVHELHPLGVACRIVAAHELAEVRVVGVLVPLVVVPEVAPCVVGRVNVDKPDLAKVRLLEQLERIQVVTLDEEILGRVEIDRLLPYGAQGFGDWRVSGERGGPLAGPVELVALLRPLDYVVGELLTEQVEINGERHIALRISRFCDDLWKEFGDALDVASCQVGRVQRALLHHARPTRATKSYGLDLCVG